jgi:superfamily I DNA and/or RNA helicase
MNVPFEAGKEHSKKSKSRDSEAKAIAEHLKEMLDSSNGKKYSYGIITFYREQVNRIYEELSKPEIGIFIKDESDHYMLSSDYWNGKYGDREYIKIGTVDAFQGIEFDFVYLSTVRSNDYKIPSEGTQQEISKAMQKKYGFLMYEKCLCVAMSRQKNALICVGDKEMLKGDAAEQAVPSLVEYYKLCGREAEYGKTI